MTSLSSRTRPLTAAVRTLLPRSGAARALFILAVVMAASAVFHTFILAADGWDWSGPTSWRKPVVFSLSLGSLAWALGWIIDRLPPRRRLAATIAGTFIVSSVVELFLIALQTWRGRPSHFNVFETGDAAIFSVMGTAVAVMSVALLALFVWLLIDRPTDAVIRWAAVAGMVYVVAGLGLGQWLIDLGFDFVDRVGVVPDTVTYGAEGVAKFPHAVAFHGIHAFMGLAAVLSVGTLSAASAAVVMRVAAGSYGLILLFASLQTLLGLAPLTVSVPLVALGATGLAGLVWACTRAARNLSVAGRRAPVLVDA